MISVKEAQNSGRSCKCVGKHVPLPMAYYDLTGVLVCPTTYQNIQSFLNECTNHRGRPPGYVRKHYSEYVQRMAKRELEISGSSLDTRGW